METPTPLARTERLGPPAKLMTEKAIVPSTAPGSEVRPPTTAYRKAVRPTTMEKLPGSTCDWYADSAPAGAATAPEKANAASRVDVAFAPSDWAAPSLSRRPMNSRPDRECRTDHADSH